MHSFWDRLPFASRLLVAASVALIVAGAAILGISAQHEAQDARADLTAVLAQELETLPQVLAEIVVIGDFSTLQQTLDRYVARSLIAHVEYRDTGGAVLSSHDADSGAPAPAWFLDLFGYAPVGGTAPVIVGGRSYGDLKLALSPHQLAARAWLRLKNHLTILLLAVSLDFAGIWLLLHFGLRPLKRLGQAVDEIAAGRLDVRIAPFGSPEFRHLILRFNHMAATLETTQDDLRQFSLAIEQSPESIVITNLDAEIEYVNAAFMAHTGYSREEVIGQNPRILQSGRTPPATFEALWQALTAGESWKGEFHNKRKDGSEYIEFVILAPLRQADGKITHYVAVKEDITEKKRIGEELEHHRLHLEELVLERTEALTEAKLAAEASNRAKSAFLANMSHELRTPMNGVMGMVDMALRRATDPQQIDWLNKSKSSAQHLLAVINDILDISKIEADRLTLETIHFQFGEVLENLLSLLGHKAEEKQLKLLVDLGPEIPRMAFLGDPLRLGQILLNLGGNALKFTDHGSITVRARRLEDGPEGVLLRIEVADTGIGIAPEDQKRLFTAFEQADGSMTRKYGGTGLGLAITKRLVHLMGGEIGVESTPGQGSTFWFTVRLVKSTDAVPPAPTFTGKSADERLLDEYAGTRILLAEDEPINQEVSRGLLEDAGLVVDLAEDGLQALALAKQNTYALILMDMQMPNLNGVDATMAIRALPAYAQTPILAMTANALNEDRQRCLDAGMNDHIAKPVDPQKLYETLLAWLEKRGN